MLCRGFEREAAYAAGRVARAHCADGCPRARALMRLKESMDSVLQCQLQLEEIVQLEHLQVKHLQLQIVLLEDL
ncbi:hypothetical protein Tco_0680984 [Tanacetum coccineum]|uniref:Uncharacterized protein n=1 Tax=Tanacetum coccineum TaxID=301880 RepID=A0ABQ4XMA5_9ASTR